MARQFPDRLVPRPTLEHTPARTMASRHQLELKYLTLLRSALRNGASPDLRWDELGLTHNMVVEAMEAHPDDLDEAVQTLATRVRTQATSDYNKLAWTAIPDGFRKRWVARHDPNTRHAHLELDGTTVKKWSPFRSGPYLLQYPGDPTAPPELTYNCRCVVVPVVPPSMTAGGYNPAQLRIPKGNEELSGRWVDSPFTLVKRVMDALPQEDRPRPKGELPERPPLGSWVGRTDRLFARTQSLFDKSTEWADYSGRLSPDQAKAVDEYRGDAHVAINNHLRGSNLDLTDRRPNRRTPAEYAQSLVEAIEEHGTVLDTYHVFKRGTKRSTLNGFDPSTYYVEGDVILEQGVMSMTVDEGIASFFSQRIDEDGYVLNIMVPPGHSIGYGDKFEGEILLNPGVIMTVVGVDQEKRQIWLEVEPPA